MLQYALFPPTIAFPHNYSVPGREKLMSIVSISK